MDIDLPGMRAQCELLLERLDGAPTVPQLRAVFMDLAPLIGEIQGAVLARRREVGNSLDVREAEAGLDRLKVGSRQVGAEIRLASEDALALGLRTTLGEAMEVIAILERSLR
jgi:hypothetical protein